LCRKSSIIFYFDLNELFLKIKNSSLASWTWIRTVNETHGEILANVSIADGHPTPINVTVFQARTVNGTK
jgi:hypothetical protein